MVDDDVVSVFREAARAFRAVLANPGEADRQEFARRLRNAVARAYLAAAQLPRGDSVTGGDPARSTLDREDGHALEGRIRARLGDAHTTVDVSLLAQELADIDRELARCVLWLEEPRPDALRAVWSAFEQRWSTHAVDVLRPLHRIARGAA